MRFFAFVFAFLVVLRMGVSAEPPKIYGKSAILFDANTGEVLYKKADTYRTPVASTQKLLTALVVAKSGDLDGKLTIEKSDTLEEPTKLYLKEGDHYRRADLLKALLVKSANDVAHALGRDNAGSIDKFADKMNREAARLGAKESNFTNANGLPDSMQLSTATRHGVRRAGRLPQRAAARHHGDQVLPLRIREREGCDADEYESRAADLFVLQRDEDGLHALVGTLL